ncbi:DUF1772 domain-containing protein [Mycobacterium sp. PS03-16]|uniref:DUF1772 domain-containing protein n=1 Tax=Mycobacterium sp. PS03-16 TaxID=2559611 RepID=UPI0010738203|nr:DUF1772 domain-containing protein [Mycobacterium sp. PS03-16]TFV55213.1 DUF1772 domain-containing protein [Mycobacterium sp. PS03-16]
MGVVTDVLATIAVLGGAVVYGCEMFAFLVLRPVLAGVDDRTLGDVIGRIHHFGDRRLPVPFATGLLAAVLTGGAAALTGRTPAAAAAAVAVLALLVWLWVFLRISAPLNRMLSEAALAGETRTDVRRLQARWERVLPVRMTAQGVALAGLCVALALP